ncbi:MAG: 5'-methylthioadenosine/S-adenosylhomocysteine nucleosidase [Verrucomicrobiia bacterium]
MKSILTIVTALLVSSSGLADTAILVALPSEQSALGREIKIVGQPVELAQHRVTIGYRKGEKLYIVRTGAGNLNSAMVTQALLTRYKIDRVISIGVAGNLNDEWKVGDLFVATNVVNHQEGKETTGGFEVKKESEARSQNSGDYWKKCAALQSNAAETAQGILTNGIPQPVRNEGCTVRQGRLVSGDSFIASTAKRKWLRETFQADAVDMVSIGIARVCEANGVPCVIVRALSDNADESASTAFANFVQNFREPATVPIALALAEWLAPKPAVSSPVVPH